MSADEGYDLLGYRALVGASTSDIRLAIRAVLGGFGPQSFEVGSNLPRYELTSAPRHWHVRRDGVSLQIDPTLEGAIGLLEWHLIAAALDYRQDLVHLHAAALADPAGSGALLLIGKSGGGKTTLTLGLTLRGFAPFCDDVTLLDPVALRPHPLRRAFHVSQQTRDLLAPISANPLPRDPHAPSDYFLPTRWADSPLPVRWIVLIEHQPGGQPQLVRLTGSQTAAAVVASSSTIKRSTRLALSTCARLTEQATCYRFIAGDLAPSLDALRDLVGAPTTVFGAVRS